MLFPLIVTLCLFTVVHATYSSSAKEYPDVYLTTPCIIRRYGYPAETHTVETKDGYLLGLHRIPYGKERTIQGKPRPVIFLQHGFLGSSADFIIIGPEKGLAFLLANRGYDVWLGNARGNTYSAAHVSLHPGQLEFWDFSWDQMAEYDLPAVIDHILDVTGQPNITYVGHSMGTTMFFALMSSKPEYNSKVRLMLGLAPVAVVQHMKSNLKYLKPWIGDLEMLDMLLGVGELLPQTRFFSYLSRLCNLGGAEEALCDNFLFLIAGFDPPQLNSTILPAILSHAPAGASVNTAIHFAQQLVSGNFSKFDFGRKKNMIKYGSTTPPLYNLKQITVPVAVFYANNDVFVSKIDLQYLTSRLPNVVEQYEVPYPMFSHVDFIYATDVVPLVYNEIFIVLNKCEPTGDIINMLKTNEVNNHYL